jgi:hypothetical protein
VGIYVTHVKYCTLYTSLLSPIRAICPAHLILVDFITRIIKKIILYTYDNLDVIKQLVKS